MTDKGVYASTTCLSGHGYRETLEAYEATGIERVELGYSPGEVPIEEVVKEYSFEFVAHNYFYPVEDPFVLNLASQDEGIRRRSIEYVNNAISFCHDHGIDQYTFHAGFRVDPDLSLDFPEGPIPEYKKSLETFCRSLETIVDYASGYEVDLAVENNVLAPRNLVDGEPLVLLCEPGEVTSLYNRLDVGADELGLLLDTGHLRVSARTIGFDPTEFVAEAEDQIAALHLHSNDGNTDQHCAITDEDYAASIHRTFSAVPKTTEAKFDSAEELQDHLRWLETEASTTNE